MRRPLPRLFGLLVLLALLGQGRALVLAQSTRGELQPLLAREQARLQAARTALQATIALPRRSPVRALRHYTGAVDRLVRSLDAQVVKELGPPPLDPGSGRRVAYQLFGMGSYGRRELAPYSDLDYGILTSSNAPAVRAYFGRYASRLSELLRAVDQSPHGLRPCNLLSPTGEYGVAVVDTSQGMARRLAGRGADFESFSVRARDYLQAALSNTRPVLARGGRWLHRDFLQAAASELGPIEAASSARAQLVERLRPSLRDPFGLPAGAADPIWSAGQNLPPAKNPKTAIREGQVNIKHDILRAFQTPILMLRERHALSSIDTEGVLRELAARGLLDRDFAASLRRAYRDALRLRTRRHLELGESEDRLGPLSSRDQRALRRMVPLLQELRRSMETRAAASR